MNFCKDCKFYYYDEYYGIIEYCRANPKYKKSYYRIEIFYAKPEIKNKDNDCLDFKPTFFSRLLKKHEVKK